MRSSLKIFTSCVLFKIKRSSINICVQFSHLIGFVCLFVNQQQQHQRKFLLSGAYFKTNSTSSHVKANSNVTLTFTLQINATCGNKSTAVNVVRVFLQEATPPHTPICQVVCRDGFDSSMGCKCDPQSHDFTVTRYIDGSRNETWILSGDLQSGEKLRTVKIQVTCKLSVPNLSYLKQQQTHKTHNAFFCP